MIDFVTDVAAAAGPYYSQTASRPLAPLRVRVVPVFRVTG